MKIDIKKCIFCKNYHNGLCKLKGQRVNKDMICINFNVTDNFGKQTEEN